MQFKNIIAAGSLGLLIAFWQESVLAVYLTCLGCMLMYAFRMFSLAASRRPIGSSACDLERRATPSQPFAVSLQLRRGELNKPVDPV